MPGVQRQRSEPTEDWRQIALLSTSAEQRTYELIRPVVLFGHSPAERARETGAAERTLYRQAARFNAAGMASLFPPPKPARHRTLPEHIRRAILVLKAEHTGLNDREIARICDIRFGQSVGHHTVKRVLAAGPPATVALRRFPPHRAIADPAQRRLAVIRLHVEGWNAKSIAQYLETSRQTVHTTLRRWAEEGVAGLDDKSRAPRQPATKTTLKALAAAKTLQENPELGAFRLQSALKQLGIRLSARTCGRVLAKNRALYGLPTPQPAPKEPRPMPFAATRRHQYWSVDIRYLDHGLDDGKVYAISILDNYSRAILASALSRTQDLTAYLMVLFAAIQQQGVPEALVSDGGSVFRAKQALAIYARLGIRKEQIAPRQPWQNYAETTFNIMRRMADWDFTRATSWAELLATHERWVVNYNYQDHWAHRQRDESARSPAAVLAWVRGRAFSPDELHRAFYATRFSRVVDTQGYVRFRHWRVYGERGLPGEHVAVWLYAEHLTVAFADEPLAQYHVAYQPDRKHLRAVAEPRLFETPFRSPQLPLWALGDDEWFKILRVLEYAPRKARTGRHVQPPLFPDPVAS
jgi:putative transposase